MKFVTSQHPPGPVPADIERHMHDSSSRRQQGRASAPASLGLLHSGSCSSLSTAMRRNVRRQSWSACTSCRHVPASAPFPHLTLQHSRCRCFAGYRAHCTGQSRPSACGGAAGVGWAHTQSHKTWCCPNCPGYSEFACMDRQAGFRSAHSRTGVRTEGEKGTATRPELS